MKKTQSATGGQPPVVTTELSMRDVFINVDGKLVGEVIEFRYVKQITAYFKTNNGVERLGTYSSFSNAKRAIINKWKSYNRKG